ncbi:unnamed protein product [Echinostoma caproni]|uniref:tRNA-5-taurinomethyluridine 2-sulfurtransferase n=1 Tax=Echinostoma caproni TaxID=27848 RepID=A0A183BCP0_9TREM|nr:unnamed protein product [Echinostoma caproni]
MPRYPKTVSGGVDSSVSAYLLKKKGFEVKGVFMTNWDPLDEGLQCSVNEDREDAKQVCERLKIPFYELNFVREYWQFVFEPLIQSYKYGATPNPDVLCNRFVKFNLLLKAWKIEADAIATGHYCQNSYGNFLENIPENEARLLRSADPVKDQTFWLSTVIVNFVLPGCASVSYYIRFESRNLYVDSTEEFNIVCLPPFGCSLTKKEQLLIVGHTRIREYL